MKCDDQNRKSESRFALVCSTRRLNSFAPVPNYIVKFHTAFMRSLRIGSGPEIAPLSGESQWGKRFGHEPNQIGITCVHRLIGLAAGRQNIIGVVAVCGIARSAAMVCQPSIPDIWISRMIRSGAIRSGANGDAIRHACDPELHRILHSAFNYVLSLADAQWVHTGWWACFRCAPCTNIDHAAWFGTPWIYGISAYESRSFVREHSGEHAIW
jgi:hypothetical protein